MFELAIIFKAPGYTGQGKGVFYRYGFTLDLRLPDLATV